MPFLRFWTSQPLFGPFLGLGLFPASSGPGCLLFYSFLGFWASSRAWRLFGFFLGFESGPRAFSGFFLGFWAFFFQLFLGFGPVRAFSGLLGLFPAISGFPASSGLFLFFSRFLHSFGPWASLGLFWASGPLPSLFWAFSPTFLGLGFRLFWASPRSRLGAAFCGPRVSCGFFPVFCLFWAFSRRLGFFPAFSGPGPFRVFSGLFLGFWTSSQPLLGLGPLRAFCGLLGLSRPLLCIFWLLVLFWPGLFGPFVGFCASSQLFLASNLFCVFFRFLDLFPASSKPSGPLPNQFT